MVEPHRSGDSVRGEAALRRAALRRRGGAVLQVAGDGVEGAAQIGADRGHHGDRGYRDQRGDQTVFDRGGAGIVAQQAQKRMEDTHRISPGPGWTRSSNRSSVKGDLSAAPFAAGIAEK